MHWTGKKRSGTAARLRARLEGRLGCEGRAAGVPKSPVLPPCWGAGNLPAKPKRLPAPSDDVAPSSALAAAADLLKPSEPEEPAADTFDGVTAPPALCIYRLDRLFTPASCMPG